MPNFDIGTRPQEKILHWGEIFDPWVQLEKNCSMIFSWNSSYIGPFVKEFFLFARELFYFVKRTVFLKFEKNSSGFFKELFSFVKRTVIFFQN